MPPLNFKHSIHTLPKFIFPLHFSSRGKSKSKFQSSAFSNSKRISLLSRQEKEEIRIFYLLNTHPSQHSTAHHFPDHLLNSSSHSISSLITRLKKLQINKRNRGNPMSNMLSWIASKAMGVTRHHFEGIGAAAVAVIIIFYVAEAYMKRKKGRLVRHYSRSQSMGALHGGKVAMQRIFDAQHARVDPAVLDGAEKELTYLLTQESLHFSKLQSVVANLEMSGKEETALKRLVAEKKKAEKNGRYHEAYELDMLIVEMLIYKGDLKGALSRKCLEDQHISDARRPLYKAIIRLMQGERRLAEESWKEFRRIKRHFHEESTHSDEVAHDHFDKFETRVQFLKKEIDAVHGGKK